jgi:hypothetical protein
MTTKIGTKNKYNRANTAIDNIIANFRKTGKYSVAFLRDLREGLSDLKKSKAWKLKS